MAWVPRALSPSWQDLLFAVLIADNQLITLLRRKRYSLSPQGGLAQAWGAIVVRCCAYDGVHPLYISSPPSFPPPLPPPPLPSRRTADHEPGGLIAGLQDGRELDAHLPSQVQQRRVFACACQSTRAGQHHARGRAQRPALTVPPPPIDLVRGRRRHNVLAAALNKQRGLLLLVRRTKQYRTGASAAAVLCGCVVAPVRLLTCFPSTTTFPL